MEKRIDKWDSIIPYEVFKLAQPINGFKWGFFSIGAFQLFDRRKEAEEAALIAQLEE